MSVSVTIELHHLADQAVSGALDRLVAALARAEGGRPKPVAPEPTEDPVAYQAFYEALPLRSQRFLDLVEARGEIRISEAMTELGIDAPKALGGITGSIGRWGPARGVALPYETITLAGERAWRWTRATKASSKSAAAPTPAPEPVTEARENLATDDLPPLSQRFLTLLQTQGEVTMSQALQQLGVPRAKAIGGVIEPVQRLWREAGQSAPFSAQFTDAGERCWRWTG